MFDFNLFDFICYFLCVEKKEKQSLYIRLSVSSRCVWMLMYILIAVTGLQDPRTHPKVTKSVHCRKSFIKNVAQIIDSETPCVIIIIINNIIEVQGPASVLWLRWSFVLLLLYYYLELLQFSLKPAVMVSGVIGSIPCGHSPASSGQTNSDQWLHSFRS